MFYCKLALTNLRKNRRSYLPFLISMLFLVAINTMTQLIVLNPGMQALPSADAARMMFSFGGVIIVIFSVIFSIYTNSFLLKQRKKELGLYNVLGLGKNELYHLMVAECALNFLFVMASGLLTGILLGKLGFLILRKLMGITSKFVFQIPLAGLLIVTLVFSGIFLLLLLINCWEIRKTDPIQLLHGGKVGERMPKTNWLGAIAGLLFLGAGYFLAVTIESPLEALTKFFIAVILVVAGTYLTFNAGSVAVLKTLKKRPRFYYQTDHFINVSSMIYRMKQNAAGLASICILSTMVLVTVATTTCLFVGQQDIVNTRYSHGLAITTPQDPNGYEETLEEVASDQGLKLKDQQTLKLAEGLLFVKEGNGRFAVMNKKQYDATMMPKGVMLHFMGLEDYRKLAEDPISLEPSEVLVLTRDGQIKGNQLQLGQDTFTIKKHLQKLKGFAQQEGLTDSYLVVMKDWGTIQGYLDKWYTTPDFATDRQATYTISANFAEGTKPEQMAFAKELRQKLFDKYGIEEQNVTYAFDTKVEATANAQNFTGGFFFLGIIFGLTFTLATALIIYYKQVSEGLDDQERFSILQKVGMSHQEVRKVIHSQILMVFAFPLLMAFLHLGFAFKIIRKLLILFGLVNAQLFLVTTIVVSLIFALLYFIVYQMTARSYYRIVER